ncbi:MAG TPA: riboflavin synthase [Syntrophorhabdales bacterium]|nr:riboflavin synthase [Syntrophorhabdales bacterium]
MFTGIIEDIGTITAIKKMSGRWDFSVRTSLSMTEIREGDSIAVDGVCLTVTGLEREAFHADASLETLNVTTLNSKSVNDKVNLERAMRADSRLGGHIVMGHVDGIGRIETIKKAGDSTVYTVAVPKDLRRYIVRKGSISVDGISLTVNEQSDTTFTVNIIPYTTSKTTIELKAPGDKVNIETDILGRYVEKFLTAGRESGIDLDFLYTYGYIRGSKP